MSNGTAITANVTETYVQAPNTGIELDTTTTPLASSGGLVSQEFYEFDQDGFVDTGGNDTITLANGSVRQDTTDSYVPDRVIYPPTLTAGVPLTETITDTTFDHLSNNSASNSTETDQITLQSETLQSVTVPAGTFQVYVITDTESYQSEGSLVEFSTGTIYVAPGMGPVETLSTSNGVTTTTELTSVTGCVAPSGALTPSIATSTFPTSLVSGAILKGKATVNVASTASGNGKATGSVVLYATTDGTITSSSQVVGSGKVSVKNGGSEKVTISPKKVSLPAGTYILVARAIDASGNTTDSAAGPTLSVAAAQVVLSATAAAVKPAAPKPGKSATIVLSISNTGNVNSTGPLAITLGLSTDGTTVTTPLPSLSKSVKVKVGKISKIIVKFILPSTILTAQYPILTLSQYDSTITVVGSSFTPAILAR